MKYVYIDFDVKASIQKVSMNCKDVHLKKKNFHPFFPENILFCKVLTQLQIPFEGHLKLIVNLARPKTPHFTS